MDTNIHFNPYMKFCSNFYNSFGFENLKQMSWSPDNHSNDKEENAL